MNKINNSTINELEKSEDSFDFLVELNEQQQKAVLCPDKSICVIAGAGCGKTKTLISRVAYLLKSKKANPDQILLLTFSKKAIEEVKNRIEKLLGTSFHSNLNIFNIHSFAYKFLKKNSYLLGFLNGEFQVYDSRHQEEVIKQIFEIDFDTIPDMKEVRLIISQISFYKLKSLDNTYNFAPMGEEREKIANAYQQHLSRNKVLDFTDLLFKTLEILKNNEEVRTMYQQQFTHILVDEFQDVNDIQ